MRKRSIYLNLSPLDHRYLLSNRSEFEQLERYLSEEASIRYCVKVELALLKSILKDDSLVAGLDDVEANVSPDEVYAEEEKTHHNIRALVNVLKRKVPAETQHLVHLGATSADILDTAASMRYRDATKRVVLPLLIALERQLITICEQEAATPQIGRTHGQHGIPLTFGFAVAEYVARLGKSIVRIQQKSGNLCGKLAGAVGAYNALSLVVADPQETEQEFHKYVGLKPSEYATQVIEPEYLLELLLELNTAFGIIANLADDLRNLQRTEIGEVKEGFTRDQVGSSTMPQKRNPWNSEHVKSLWKTFAPRVVTFFLDQISEHQRDLSNSASSRFVASYYGGFVAAANRMKSVLASLFVDRERMSNNLGLSGDLMLSEAAYILLAMGGDLDAHEKVRKATLACEKTGRSLLEVLKEDASLWETICTSARKNLAVGAEEFFGNPSRYTGIACKKAQQLAHKYASIMAEVEEALG